MKSSDWFDVFAIDCELVKLMHKTRKVQIGAGKLKDLIRQARLESQALMAYLENCPAGQVADNFCDCECGETAHGPYGCKTWYGDNNTGFGCDCNFKVRKKRMTCTDSESCEGGDNSQVPCPKCGM